MDEDYHGGEEQAIRDHAREQEISRILDCKICRIDTYSKPVFTQIDETVAMIKKLLRDRNIPAWKREAPEERHTGEYASKQIDALERAGAFSMMESFAEETKRLGYEVEFSSFNGIPSPSSGEAGFILRMSEVVLTINRRASGPGLRLLIADQNSASILMRAGYECNGHQLLSKPDGPGKWRYFSFKSNESRKKPDDMIKFLDEIASKLKRQEN